MILTPLHLILYLRRRRRSWPLQETYKTGVANVSEPKWWQTSSSKITSGSAWLSYLLYGTFSMSMISIPRKERSSIFWALVFLKVHPKQDPVCTLVGETKGAADPKTFQKWMWKIIFNIELLNGVVVSLYCTFTLMHKPTSYLVVISILFSLFFL